MTGKKEERFYQPVKEALESQVVDWTSNRLGANPVGRFSNGHLEITAKKHFSNSLKAKVPKGREIIFRFLKEAFPDMTGYVEREYYSEFIVVEIKAEELKLDDIYQARKYADLFDARYVLLISTEEIPEEIRRLSEVAWSMLQLTVNRITLVHFDPARNEFKGWLPENPFLTLNGSNEAIQRKYNEELENEIIATGHVQTLEAKQEITFPVWLCGHNPAVRRKLIGNDIRHDKIQTFYTAIQNRNNYVRNKSLTDMDPAVLVQLKSKCIESFKAIMGN